jgi:predicted aldo/keto reductase-like oxidoreductase
MGRSLPLGRRQFFKKSALGMIGAGVAARKGMPADPGQAGEPSRIKEYRVFGRTGFKVSDLGCGSIMDDGVLRAAFEAGMNYVDTAEQYPGHHAIVAKAMKGRDRESVFVTTKLEVLEDKSKEGFLKRTRKALEELRTEYIDCLMMHMPERTELLKTEGFHAAMAELKTEGRVRHVGISNHGSFWFRDPEETMERVLGAAAEDGRFDVFLMAHNFLMRDQSDRVLDLCGRKKIGVALMKTTPLAIYETLKTRIEDLEKKKQAVDPLYADGLKRYREKFEAAREFVEKHKLRDTGEIRDAAVRFVLGNPNVGTVCCLVKTYNELEAFIRLSGSRLSGTERVRLETYREGCGGLYCRHACGVCEPGCPAGVPVNTIMRYQHYFLAQGREKEALELYDGIPGPKADACVSCPGPCEARCPYGVPIQGMLIAAHDLLTLT